MKFGVPVKRLFLLIIVLYVFLLSIDLMGFSFKLFGTGFAESIIAVTSNPLVSLFIGILATSVVQSSSVTTSIVVGLTASGALSIGNAIPMILGANIGTSITNTIVSLGHITKKGEFRKAFEVATVHDFFNLLGVIIIFPLELFFHVLERSASYLSSMFVGANTVLQFTSPANIVVKPISLIIQNLLSNNAIIILIVALASLFISLRFFVKIMRPLTETEFKHLLHKHIFKSQWRSLFFGIVLTVMVQSSSVSTSLIVPLVGVGMITLHRVFPYIIGANIGTTITAFLAALVTGSPAALTVAFAHLLFNVFGLVIIYPIKQIPIAMSEQLARFSVQSKFYPFIYIVSFFYLIPISIIWVFH